MLCVSSGKRLVTKVTSSLFYIWNFLMTDMNEVVLPLYMLEAG